MMKKALIVYGGWDGNQHKQNSEVFSEILKSEGFEVAASDSLDSFKDEDNLMKLNLIIPVWTMGEITDEQLQPVLKAVPFWTISIFFCKIIFYNLSTYAYLFRKFIINCYFFSLLPSTSSITILSTKVSTNLLSIVFPSKRLSISILYLFNKSLS